VAIAPLNVQVGKPLFVQSHRPWQFGLIYRHSSKFLPGPHQSSGQWLFYGCLASFLTIVGVSVARPLTTNFKNFTAAALTFGVLIRSSQVAAHAEPSRAGRSDLHREPACAFRRRRRMDHLTFGFS
jgi:hypothetical protein